MFRSPGSEAFRFGPFAIHWYGILIAAGVLLGTIIACREATRRGENADTLLNILVYSVIAALLGSRLYYVLFNWSYYRENIAKAFALWEGGLAIHGGIAGGFIIGFVLLKLNRLPVGKFLDIVAPSMILGQAIGRWGNFFNQEAFGVPTELPWKLFIDPAHRPEKYAQSSYFHPTFLYESLWNFLVFATLFWVLRKRLERYQGTLFLSYLGLYSVGRFFTESLRTDSLMLGSLRAAQLVSVGLILLGAIAIPAIIVRKRRYRLEVQGDESRPPSGLSP